MKKLVAFALLIALTAAIPTNAQMKAGKMQPSVEVGYSAFGLAYGASFEYGVTDKISARGGFTLTSYSTGGNDWFLLPIDLVGVYNVDDQKYAMLGLNFTKYDVDLGTSDKSKSSIGAMAGAGYRYKLTDKISANAEGKYRLITLDAGNGVKLTGAWYSVGVGFSYALN